MTVFLLSPDPKPEWSTCAIPLYPAHSGQLLFGTEMPATALCACTASQQLNWAQFGFAQPLEASVALAISACSQAVSRRFVF